MFPSIPAPELEIDQLTHRELMWLCCNLWGTFEYQSIDQLRSTLTNHVNASEENYNKAKSLHGQSKHSLVLDVEIDWIKPTDIRLLRWLTLHLHENYVMTNRGLQLSLYSPDPIKHERLIYALDAWGEMVQLKTDVIKRAHLRWSEILLQNKKLKWLEPENDAQMEWAWNYVNESSKISKPVRAATSTTERYLGILEIFDCWRQHPAELKDCIATMKRAWAQQKYRQNLVGKQQCNFVLSKETVKKLNTLTKSKGIKPGQVLENIIDKEFALEFPGKKR